MFVLGVDIVQHLCYYINRSKETSKTSIEGEQEIMKTAYSEEYYKKELVRSRIKANRRAIDLEQKLESAMSIFSNVDFGKDQIEILVKFYAKQIYDEARKQLIENKRLYVKVRKDGGNCLGYTNKSQEIKAVCDIIETFEYNCLILKEFKEKYNL